MLSAPQFDISSACSTVFCYWWQGNTNGVQTESFLLCQSGSVLVHHKEQRLACHKYLLLYTVEYKLHRTEFESLQCHLLVTLYQTMQGWNAGTQVPHQRSVVDFPTQTPPCCQVWRAAAHSRVHWHCHGVYAARLFSRLSWKAQRKALGWDRGKESPVMSSIWRVSKMACILSPLSFRDIV